MIYIDVTSSCASPMNTGVQRMVRGLFRNLDADFPVTPLTWDARRESYCLLSDRERGFLEKPFAGLRARKNRAEPGRLENPIPLFSKLWRNVSRRHAVVDLPVRLRSSDTFLVPEIFQDNRLGGLKNLRAKTQARRVAVFHDAITWRRPDLASMKRQEGFADYMSALAAFDEVIAVSEEAADDLREFWQETGDAISATIQVNPWAVDDLFATARSEPAVFSKRMRILCVGTLEPRKNHLTLLEAAEKIWRERGPIFELTFIGRTKADFGHRVIAKLEELRRNGRPVRWHRHVDDEKLIAAYDACAFTVFPSLVEGFGLPVIESLRRGRPCICGSNGALGERARDGGCLTVDQTNADALAAAMQRLLTDESLYWQLVEEARARPYETWKNFIDKLRLSLSPSLALTG